MKTTRSARIAILVLSLASWFAVWRDGRAVAAPGSERIWSAGVEQALNRAGTNRAQLVQALNQATDAQVASVAFLIENMPGDDLTSLSASYLLTNVSLALDAWKTAPWAGRISEALFRNDILPYASVSENREDWRQKIRALAVPIVADCKTPGEAAMALNKRLFPQLGVHYSTKRRAPDQGPLETIESKVATCTGLSILLVDACRSVGVPARVVGTPLWANRSGNHTWVEIWDGDWHFLGAAEPDPAGWDRGWFVGNASQAIRNSREQAIYASSFEKTGLTFPLSWDRDADYVNAVNVTDRYAAPAKPVDLTKMTLRVNVLDRPVGTRVAAHVSITDSSDPALHWEGTSKTEPADMNDHIQFQLPRERTYIVEAMQGDRTNRRFYSPGTNADDLLIVHLTGVPVVPAPTAAFCAAPLAPKPLAPGDEAALKNAATQYFTAPAAAQAGFTFPAALDHLLFERENEVRRAVWEAFVAAPIHDALRKGFDENKVHSGDHTSPYTLKTVGKRPPNGWALFIAMHGGGGAPQELNDSQWKTMQRYYRDHPEVGGYRYVALRAPNNEWNGFYTGYVYPLIANLINQFVLFADIDVNKVFLMGYSHGGYGAFAIGPKMPDRFAAIHASAAALADGANPQTLRNTVFTCMVGERDTAYGRIERDREFDAAIKSLRGDRTDIFPVTVSIVADHPHSGLPDREKIAEMYPAVRNPVPRELTWPMTDSVITDFFWLHTDAPAPGRELDATCRNNHLTVTTTNLSAGTILLDSRLVDLTRPITLECNGQTVTRTLVPSLRTLCESMQRRGDPDLAFTVRLDLPLAGEANSK